MTEIPQRAQKRNVRGKSRIDREAQRNRESTDRTNSPQTTKNYKDFCSHYSKGKLRVVEEKGLFMGYSYENDGLNATNRQGRMAHCIRKNG